MLHITARDGLSVTPYAFDVVTGTPRSVTATPNDDDRRFSAISGEGVFVPQTISAKGSVIVGDNHFNAGEDGEALTGMDHRSDVWTNGSATSMEEKLELGRVTPTADQGWWTIDGADFRDPPTENSVNKLRSENRFVIERFEPAAGLDSYGETPTSPVPEVADRTDHYGFNAMTGKMGDQSSRIYSPECNDVTDPF